jgi:DNA-binding NtrC family response regulator
VLNRNYRRARVGEFVNSRDMKTPVIALLTNDHSLEECLAQALPEIGGHGHFLHHASDVLSLLCAIDRQLDFVVIDCEHGPHGLTLVGAINSRRDDFPVIVITGLGEGLIEALAYANGASACFSKPFTTEKLLAAMKQCRPAQPQLSILA